MLEPLVGDHSDRTGALRDMTPAEIEHAARVRVLVAMDQDVVGVAVLRLRVIELRRSEPARELQKRIADDLRPTIKDPVALHKAVEAQLAKIKVDRPAIFHARYDAAHCEQLASLGESLLP